MIRPTLRQLEYAVAVADHGHFGRAAEAVHVTQPGLSTQIQQLENRLGVKLFERSHRGIRPTEVGAEIVDRSRNLLREVDELVAAASLYKGTIRGRLRIAAIPTIAPYLLPALTRTVRERWPGAYMEIQELRTAEMVTAIEHGDIDLGLLAIPYNTGSLHVATVAEESFHLAVPADHELAETTSTLPVAVLADLQVLLLSEGHCLRDHAMNVCEMAGRVDHSEIEAAGLSTLIQMVVAGVGVTLLPACAIALEARSGVGIVTRAFQPPAPGRAIALVWRTGDPRFDLFAEMIDDFAAQVRSDKMND